MKKVTVFVLAMLLVFNLSVPTFATSVASVTMTADKTSISAGETVTVTVSTDNAITNLNNFELYLYYNADALIKSDAATGADNTGITIGDPVTENERTRLSINKPDASGDPITINAGAIATVTFTAKEDLTADSTSGFDLANWSLDYDTFEKAELTFAAIPEVAITTESAPVTYAVSVDEGIVNGTVQADKETAEAGETVTLTATHASGYILESLTYTYTPEGGTETTADITDSKSFVMPAAPVTVSATFKQMVHSYTVTLDEDSSIVAGETEEVEVTVGHTDSNVTSFNAFDMTFTYDPAVLKLTSTEIEGLTITDNNGTVRIQRYGSDMAVGSAAFKLSFEAIGTGETTVTATAAKVGVAESAHELDAADATILDDDTVITIGGYTVTLPGDFTGESTVAPGEDYTFTANDKNYTYTVTATMGGENVTVIDNGDGTYTVENIIDNLVITSTKEGKTVSVSLGDDMTGETSAQYMTNYTATLTKVAGYTYSISVEIGGNEYTGFSYDETTGVVTIPGAAITGDIAFNSNRTPVQSSEYTVTFEGSGSGDAVGEATVAAGADYSFTLTKAVGYEYTVSYKMGNSTEPIALTEADGKFTIEKVSGNLVITVEKTSDLAVAISEYVQLNDKSVFLVKATGTLAEGKAYAYDGTAMYYSNVYNAWSYLVIVNEGETFTADDAKAKIAAAETAYTSLEQSYDVNMSAKVDINDAQLVYNIYNCEYEDFSTATMQKFLYADTNGDGIVNTSDAAAIIEYIVETKQPVTTA